MAVNDFLAFATAVDAHVITQTEYLADAFRTDGFSNGIAIAEQLNKVWRQSGFISAALAQYVSNQTGLDTLDDGDLAGFIAKLSSAIVIGAGVKPARIVTSSANMNILLTDYRVGFARVAGVANTQATLPAGAVVGQSFKIGDLQGNVNPVTGFPITVVPQGGQNIAQRANFIIDVDRTWYEFAFMGSNTWSVEQ